MVSSLSYNNVIIIWCYQCCDWLVTLVLPWSWCNNLLGYLGYVISGSDGAVTSPQRSCEQERLRSSQEWFIHESQLQFLQQQLSMSYSHLDSSGILTQEYNTWHNMGNLSLSSGGLPLRAGYSQSRSSPSSLCCLRYSIDVSMKWFIFDSVDTCNGGESWSRVCQLDSSKLSEWGSYFKAYQLDMDYNDLLQFSWQLLEWWNGSEDSSTYHLSEVSCTMRPSSDCQDNLELRISFFQCHCLCVQLCHED